VGPGTEELIEALSPSVLRVGGGIFAALALGSVVRWIGLRSAEEDEARSLRASLGVWWAIAAVVSGALFLGRWGVVVLFAAVSGAGVREFVHLSGLRGKSPGLGREAIAFAAGGPLFVLLPDGGEAFLVGYPALALLWIGARLVLRGRSENFTLLAGAWILGVFLVGYGPAHALLPYAGAGPPNPVGGPAGWLLLFLVLSQMSDIFQALVGKRVGRRSIAPVLSPRKTWEGFLGGVGGTALLGGVLGPLLTPLGSFAGAGLGVAVAGAGFVGDVTISGVKRDAGVEDSGTCLPGHGGVLDRIDSLLLSAPLFFHLIRVL